MKERAKKQPASTHNAYLTLPVMPSQETVLEQVSNLQHQVAVLEDLT